MKVLTASLGCWLLLLWFSAAGAEEVKVNMLGLSRDSTVMIVSRGSNSKGTGFLIGDEHVMTCFHVVAELSAQSTSINWNVYPDLQVVLPSGEVIDGTVISVPTQADATPLTQDFAIIKLKTKPTKSFPTVQMASEKEHLKVGDDLVFSGYPLATPGMVTHRGMVSGFDKSGSLIFLQAAINKGNSGGALLNDQGHVVGIVSMREGGISQGLGELQVYIDKTSKEGSVQIMGVDPLQATKAIIQTLDQYISTGIGYARSIKFARDYLSKHPELMK
ncbi:MAG TPA: serine protease [Syntrophales bacterium]|nr:serine protease [Syntrophales bacterium]